MCCEDKNRGSVDYFDYDSVIIYGLYEINKEIFQKILVLVAYRLDASCSKFIVFSILVKLVY